MQHRLDLHFVKSAASIFLSITGVALTSFAIERLTNTRGVHGLRTDEY